MDLSDKLLTLGKLYGFYLYEVIIRNHIVNLDLLNFYNLGLEQEELEIGLQYLTMTHLLDPQVNHATIN
jgi:hypothetical protein